MEKTKSFIQQNLKWKVLEECILRIEGFSNTEYGLVVENCKSLIESIFKTIIREVDKKTDDDLKNWNISKLYKRTKTILQIEKEYYVKIIGSFSSTIAQYRNKLGEISHGKDIYTLQENKNALIKHEVEFLLSMTDSIAFFILSAYSNHYPNFTRKNRKLAYQNYEEFNEWFDGYEPPVIVKGSEFSQSKVLFNEDEEAYKIELLEYREKDELIESLKNSPNFRSTHDIIKKLSQHQVFSDIQIRRIGKSFMQNSQINLIATNRDVQDFFKLVIENQAIFTEHELNLFLIYYDRGTIVLSS